MDPKFRVEVISKTLNPQTTIWFALRQDYSGDYVYDFTPPSEDICGEIAVRKLLSGKRGHYGPFEHPQITFNVGYFPHSVMQQARTHRVGVSMDVSSLRYTGDHICDVAEGKRSVEDVFYLRPTGDYYDRSGNKYRYTEQQRQEDLNDAFKAAKKYKMKTEDGMPNEQARGSIPFDVRQHFLVSFNMRSLMHFLNLRGKRDAQLEIQQLTCMMLPHFEAWSPQIYEWYIENEWLKSLPAA